MPVKDVLPDISHHNDNQIDFVQGNNSNISKFLGQNSSTTVGYTGPLPPDKTHDYTLTVYVLDQKLDLQNGFWLNDFLRKLKGHVVDEATIQILSRAN